MFVAKPRGTNFAKFFTFGPDAKMRQIETIKPFLPKSNSPHNHWVCVTGQFTEEPEPVQTQSTVGDKRLDFVVSPGSGPERSERSI